MTPLQQEARRVTDWVLTDLRHRPGDRLWLAWNEAECRVWCVHTAPESPGGRWLVVEWPAVFRESAPSSVGPRGVLALEQAIGAALERAAEERAE